MMSSLFSLLCVVVVVVVVVVVSGTWRDGSVFSPRYRRYYNLIVIDVSVLVATVRLAKLSIDAIISQ